MKTIRLKIEYLGMKAGSVQVLNDQLADRIVNEGDGEYVAKDEGRPVRAVTLSNKSMTAKG